MLAFAGIEPGINESGTVSHGGRMVKRGSSQLRYGEYPKVCVNSKN